MARYEMKTVVSGTMDQVRPRVLDALKQQGFGILTEIDVRKTLKEKLGEDMEDYVILGACNPQLAHRALEADRSIGLLLPCNVVLRETSEGTEVSILDPRAMFEMVDAETQQKMQGLPEEARQRLHAAIEALSQPRSGA